VFLPISALVAVVSLVIAGHAGKNKERNVQEIGTPNNPCGGRFLRDEELKDLFRNTVVRGHAGSSSYTVYSSDGSGYEYIDKEPPYPFRFFIKDRKICILSNDGKVTACDSYVINKGKVFNIIVNNGPFPRVKGGYAPSGCVEMNFFRPEGRSSQSR
jgi:hypothetical protein